MNRFDIIRNLAKEKSLKVDDAEKIVDIIIDEISKALIIGERAEFRDFGVFYSKRRKKRQGRNPKTGEKITVNTKNIPHFRISKFFFQRIN